jgi:hypothetical protein
VTIHAYVGIHAGNFINLDYAISTYIFLEGKVLLKNFPFLFVALKFYK